MQRFDRDNRPPDEAFTLHRKKVSARMVRIDGPFECVSKEGVHTCPDGWLALDSSGSPYAIRASDYDEMYEEA